jgi:hypothetical protein
MAVSVTGFYALDAENVSAFSTIQSCIVGIAPTWLAEVRSQANRQGILRKSGEPSNDTTLMRMDLRAFVNGIDLSGCTGKHGGASRISTMRVSH